MINNCPGLCSSPAWLARRVMSAVRAFWVSLVLLSGSLTSHAQWLTQTNVLPPGWSAVYLYVDASSQTLDSLVGLNPACPIDQIWLWKTLPGTAQYISSPAMPLLGNSQWLNYYRPGSGLTSTLGALIPNTAYLVHNSQSTNYTWTLQGQPVPPSYVWDNTGLNFIGFNTPFASPPTWQNFLAPAPALAAGVQLYQYTGGPFNAQNPAPVYSQYTTRVTRGQAFWLSDTNINNTYFGPFTLTLPNPLGLTFGSSVGQLTIHVFNQTSNSLIVRLKLLPSETPVYSGQTSIVGPPPLLVKGALNSSNLTYAYSALPVGSNTLVTLAPSGQPGSDVAVVLGVNRFALTNSPGSLYAGILQFSDSLGLSEVDVPVSATAASNAGLWVGNASVSQVGSYLKTYATNGDGSYVQQAVTNQVYTTNFTAFNITNLFITNSFITNIVVANYLVTNWLVNTYTTNWLVITTNSFVPVTNLVVNSFAVTNTTITTTVTNYYLTNNGVVWLTANTTNISGSLTATTNYVPGTNAIAATTNRASVSVASQWVNYLTITNYLTTNGVFLAPVTSYTVASVVQTNSLLATNLAFNLLVTNPFTLSVTNGTLAAANYATTNLAFLNGLGTNYLATNNAPVIYTNGLTEIVISPQFNQFIISNTLQTTWYTNFNVISNNYTLVTGGTNLTFSTTNLVSSLSGSVVNSTGTNYTVTSLVLFTNYSYYVATNQIIGSYSNYVVTALNTNLGAVPAAFPLRLIVFNDGTNACLLQRVYCGLNTATNLVIATTESDLDPAQLGTARRISAAHLPWTAANNPIPFSGTLAQGGTLTATLIEDYGDQPANPFLHTFHPDHNNLDLSQSPPRELPVGSQSYTISRQFTLTVLPNSLNFLSLINGNTALAGTYQEVITLTGLGGAARTFNTAGTFSLTRVSPIATLNQ
ncbi:MAG: hypothetical protein WCS94_17530 [Verrucomicrobiota bacterium]